MGSNQIHLEFANLISNDPHIAQLAYARCDGIRHLVTGDEFIDDGARPIHGLSRVRRQQRRPPVDRNFADILQREVVSVDVESLHRSCEQ